MKLKKIEELKIKLGVKEKSIKSGNNRLAEVSPGLRKIKEMFENVHAGLKLKKIPLVPVVRRKEKGKRKNSEKVEIGKHRGAENKLTVGEK